MSPEPPNVTSSRDLIPRLNDRLDLAGTNLTPEDYFVLTRIDGRIRLRELILMTGFPAERTLEIVAKLRQLGAILLPGDPTPPPEPAASPRRPAAPGRSTVTPGPAPPPPAAPGFSGPVAAEAAEPVIHPDDRAYLDEEVDLTLEQKQAILSRHRKLRGATLFEFLGVEPDVDKAALRRVYFRLSKEFHPDRFFGRSLGTFQARLAAIFEHATKAFDLLSDDARRAAYVAQLAERRAAPPHQGSTRTASEERPRAERSATAPPRGAGAPGPRSAPATAPSLFEDACQHQVTGELDRALVEFAEAIALDPQVRYLCRGADAALQAGDLSLAERYAKKAAEIDSRNAIAHRTLARIFRAQGRLPEARQELVLAHRLEPDNGFIAAELDALGGMGET